MKINIASTNRFHLLDLARELEKQGNDVKFYSIVPTKRCTAFGLNRKSCKCLLWLVFPFIILDYFFHCSLFIRIRNIILDYYLAIFMRPCDVYICLGSVYKQSIIYSKRKYNAITILEWGSKHIIEQLKMFNNKNYSSYALNRELEEYNLVDYISIATNHVKLSFINHNIPEKKLIINPYGVDLKQFHPTILAERNYDIIMVGGWRREKGCDLLLQACKKYKFSLLHVGTIVNMKFPNDTNMKHIDAVDQKELINYYSQAKVFALPSYAEGLAMVQAQALACGLPIVCSTETGGRDLRELLTDKKWIIEMKNFTVDELGKCILKALQLSKEQIGVRDYAQNDILNFTWEAYGKRYNDSLKNIKYGH